MSQLIELRPDAGERTHIDGVVLKLRELRAASQKNRYQGGPLPELPSRDAMIEIVDALVSVIYPRHFGPPGLRAGDLDIFIAKTLDATSQSLDEQVRRELLLFRAMEIKRPPIWSAARPRSPENSFWGCPRSAHCSTPTSGPLSKGIRPPKAIMRSCFVIRASRRLFAIASRINFTDWASRCWRGSLRDRSFRDWHDIHPGAEIGEGFFIDHGTGVVIGETAVIGRACGFIRRSPGGAAFRPNEKALVKGRARHPIIEDDVMIFAGATVLGRVTIGRGSAIGGNVWLTQSVETGTNVTQAKARRETFDNGGGI